MSREGCMLHPHQFDSLKWMAALVENDMNGLLADDMGLGKTIQAISLICYIWETKRIRNKPHLIIAPKSTISNWMREFAKWAPDLKTINLNPKQEFREDILREMRKPGNMDVCVTTYDALLRVPELRSKFSWYLIVFDEAHKLKNTESIMIQLSRKLPSVRRLLMTGTPLQNNLTELWSLLNFMMPQLFTSAKDFNDWFNFDTSEYNEHRKEQKMTQDQKFLVIQILHRVIKPFMLRRTKDDLATKLPSKTEINISVQLSPL